MGTIIDEKTVKLDFDNKRFQTGVKDSLDSANALKKGLDFSGSAKSLSSIDDAAKKVNFGVMAQGVDSIKNRFSALGIVGITVIQDITRKATQMFSQLTRTFITDPIKSGLDEYETQINAIQTILANTASKGTNLEQVNEKLGELNTYADKTIYNFTEMTRNIGTFTAAGVGLNTSVEAIKGIANLAAVSGSNSQQAATAMYQLSQALSSGTVKLMDWNSVVNAGMGGQVFQDALKETARLHNIAIDQMIEDEGSFRETLSEGWLSSDILTETLAKFTGDLTEAQLKSMGYADDQIEGILKLGVTANDAATKVKTLTQLTDTLKEAAQSGWTQTWELIIGDFNQAKSFWTEVSDTLGAIIGESANARNAIVQEWNNLGGRTILLQTIRQLFEDILAISKPIGEALKEIFPPTTGKQLFELSLLLKELAGKLKIGAESAEKVKRIFKGVFAVFDIGRMLLVSFAKNLGILSEGFGGAIPGLVDWLAKVGDWIVGIRDAVKEGKSFDAFFTKLFASIKPVINGIVGLFAGLIGAISGLKKPKLEGLEAIGNTFQRLKDKFTSGGGARGEAFAKVFEIFGKALEKFEPIAKRIGELATSALGKFLDWIENFIDNFDPNAVLKVLNGGLFAGVLLSLKGFINSSKSLIGGGLFVAILKSVKDFIDKGGSVFENAAGILDGVKDVLKAYQNDIKANTLIKIAGAVGILALSILALAFIDPTRLLAATSAITVMFGELMYGIERMSKSVGGIKSIGAVTAALLGISVSLFIMATALRKIAKLDPKDVAVGLGAVTVLLAEMAAFAKFASISTGLSKAETVMLIMSAALFVLAKALSIFGEMPLDQIGVGLLGMAGALLVITTAINALPEKGITSKAIGILTISASLLVMAEALKKLGELSWEQLAVGLAALAGTLAILAVSLNVMQASISGAAAMLVAAAAVGILAVSLAALGSLSLEQIGIGLLALVGIFTVLGIAGYALTPVVPVLLGLAAAIALIGVAALALGAGVLAFSTGLAALAAVGAAGVASISLVITVLAKTLPALAEGIGNAIVTLISTIASKGKELAASFLSLLRTGIKAFTEIVPELAKAAFDMITSFLQVIRDNIGEVTKLGSDIIINFMDAMSTRIPELIESGHNLVISVIDGMADSVEKNLPRLIDSITRLGVAIVQGLVEGMFSARGRLIDGVKELAGTVLGEFKEALGIHSPSTAFYDVVGYIADGMVLGFDRFGGRMVAGATGVVDNVISAFDPIANAITNSLDENVDYNPQITPVVDLTNVESSGKTLDGMLGSKKMAVGLSLDTARRTVLPGDISNNQTDGRVPQDKGGEFTYIQNNYSPKALSAIDIYRQTNKQLFKTKRQVGAQ